MWLRARLVEVRPAAQAVAPAWLRARLAEMRPAAPAVVPAWLAARLVETRPAARAVRQPVSSQRGPGRHPTLQSPPEAARSPLYRTRPTVTRLACSRRRIVSQARAPKLTWSC